jgi:hypothetical protein
MKRSEVKDFIQSGAELLNIPFETGRITEFNSSRSNTYPFIFLESVNVLTSLSYSLPTDTWKIRIHVAFKDSIDSKMEQYENLIDQADDIAKSLVKRYNDILTNYNLATISGISRTPFIKKHADCLTGVLLGFDLISQDVNGCD